MKIGRLFPDLVATLGRAASSEAGFTRTLKQLVALSDARAGGLRFRPGDGAPVDVIVGARRGSALERWIQERLERPARGDRSEGGIGDAVEFLVENEEYQIPLVVGIVEQRAQPHVCAFGDGARGCAVEPQLVEEIPCSGLDARQLVLPVAFAQARRRAGSPGSHWGLQVRFLPAAARVPQRPARARHGGLTRI